MTTHVEDATIADAEELTRIVRTSSAYDGHYRVMVAELGIDADYLAEHLVRVARDGDGRPLGFHTVIVPGRGAEDEGELDYMFVDDAAQGRGLGRLLITDACRQARARGLRRLHVVSHPPSEGFYLSVGARRVGTVPPAGEITWSRPHLAFEL
ncbi:Acetyltransferase (GNAT) domain-containing protein [Saccharopolyspora antimicrobica]|uniref:Acetyltransferase (GNAT) domain-containing protein n=1 Tax=Saccharopolyspora antimicrobica TaxID=455193 RepID=A0A1I4RBR7_9PSEU|nr:GNAT family N-acetyltransferase [Saccharopolyspora antimicrobica]RKT88075.1 acetyltransferase (GNAT) family protein [Saccharopolyspora antimicrobica]SFM49691.1 Acetyltransferase (GNAT) domain-containing protein [Saccharopolyspora antimicrobica]